MGSRQHNFYNEVYQRAGYAEMALQVQDLWLKRQRKEKGKIRPMGTISREVILLHETGATSCVTTKSE
jgi:hypothetical protein